MLLAGDAQFAGCIAMVGPNQTCVRCDGKCGISNHYHARKKVQKVIACSFCDTAVNLIAEGMRILHCSLASTLL